MKAAASAVPMPTQAQMLESLWVRSQIEAVMLSFGRALDLGDWKAYRSCWWSISTRAAVAGVNLF
jgi:hypothetical protein